LDRAGTVWVTDFGLAKVSDADDLTHTGEIVGTLRYVAPERLRGEVDLRGDIYSLGVTLYEMLVLRPPFQDHDRPRLVRRIMDEEPARPREIDPRIPHDLETIVMKAISKTPRTATRQPPNCPLTCGSFWRTNRFAPGATHSRN
jgi:serine/threonine protein kinase